MADNKYTQGWMSHFGDLLLSVPSITYIWEAAQNAVDRGDLNEIARYEKLIYLLHNSYVSPLCKLGKNVKFGYGGIGVVLHKNASLGDGVTVAQNVTIGGTPGSKKKNRLGYVPIVEENVYIATGSKLLGGIVVGKFSIIGANSVVLSNVEAFSVYAGVPAKKVNHITKSNCLKYKNLFPIYRDVPDKEFSKIFPEKTVRKNS